MPYNTNSLNGEAEILNLQWFLTFIAMFELFPVKIDISQVQNWSQNFVDCFTFFRAETEDLQGRLQSFKILRIVFSIYGNLTT